jgi:hypothetical protein
LVANEALGSLILSVDIVLAQAQRSRRAARRRVHASNVGGGGGTQVKMASLAREGGMWRGIGRNVEPSEASGVGTTSSESGRTAIGISGA